MTFISFTVEALLLLFAGVGFYNYAYERYVADAKHPIVENICLAILSGLYIIMAGSLLLR
ncbi:MAG: hypothetical protein ACI4M9_03175 [Succinivibrio sp.]